MTTTLESLLEQARAIWPISWSVENGDLRGVYEPGGVELTISSVSPDLWIVTFQGEWSTWPFSAGIGEILGRHLPILRDGWWSWWIQQEGAISDLEQQVLADSSSAAPVVWLRLQQIKWREADKHRMMVRVERNRIRTMQDTIRRVLTAYDAQDFDLYSVLEALRSLLPESHEGDAL